MYRNVGKKCDLKWKNFMNKKYQKLEVTFIARRKVYDAKDGNIKFTARINKSDKRKHFLHKNN